MERTAEPSSWRTRLRLVGGLALGAAMLAWFLSSLQWVELWETLRSVSWGWVLTAAALMLADYALHAFRWGILLRHVDPDLDFRTLWAATTVGWGFNTLLPLRAGNFLRPAVVSLRRGVPYTTLLMTTIAEYVCDVFGVVLMILALIWLLPPEMVATGPLHDVKSWGTWAAALALLALVAVVLLSSRQARDVFERMVRPLPTDRGRETCLRIFDELIAGMAAIGHPLRLLQALVVTIGIWGGWLLAIVATFQAFDLVLPLAGALFMEAALTLSMLVPQAPGFLGVFQKVVEEALTLWQAPVAKAQGIALVFWAVCFVPITVLGVIDGWRQGLHLFTARSEVFEDLEERADS